MLSHVHALNGKPAVKLDTDEWKTCLQVFQLNVPLQVLFENQNVCYENWQPNISLEFIAEQVFHPEGVFFVHSSSH